MPSPHKVLDLIGYLGRSDRCPSGEEVTEVLAVLIEHRRVLVDDVEFVDDAEIHERDQPAGVQGHGLPVNRS